jgi:hypothetical protein
MASFELSAEDKAKLYDESPLCNVVLDSGGIARSGNAAFVDHMGELFKYVSRHRPRSFARLAARCRSQGDLSF